MGEETVPQHYWNALLGITTKAIADHADSTGETSAGGDAPLPLDLEVFPLFSIFSEVNDYFLSYSSQISLISGNDSSIPATKMAGRSDERPRELDGSGEDHGPSDGKPAAVRDDNAADGE